MKKLLFFLFLTINLANTAQAKTCEIDREIRFAGMNWLSNQIKSLLKLNGLFWKKATAVQQRLKQAAHYPC